VHLPVFWLFYGQTEAILKKILRKTEELGPVPVDPADHIGLDEGHPWR
jgi:hypothetical protein